MAIDPVSALGLVGQIGGLFGARSARKKQKRMIKKMMADRAKRIAKAKGEFDKSRRGLLTENRAMMMKALAQAPMMLGPSLMAGSTSANLMRGLYRDSARRAAEIGRQTAAGKAELEMLSPFDIVDPSSMGASRGAETQALMGVLKGIGGMMASGGPNPTTHGAMYEGAGGHTYMSDATKGQSVAYTSPFPGQTPKTTGATPGSGYMFGYPEHTFNF